MDVVTNAIAQRLRATATIEGEDPHAVELTLGGESFAGTVELDPDGAAADDRGGADDRGWCRAHHHQRHERRAERPGHDARGAGHVAGDGRRDG